MELACSPEWIARITEALLDAEPGVEVALERALRAGVGLRAEPYEQIWWPGVLVLWVAIGSGTPLVRYVAIPSDEEQPTVLTGSEDGFNAVAAGRTVGLPDRDSLLGYTLFFLEVTRPMDRPVEMLDVDVPTGNRWWDLGRALLALPARVRDDAVARLRRLEPDGFEAAEAVVRAAAAPPTDLDGPVFERLRVIGFSEAELGTLERALRLPAGALDPAERRLVARAHRALPPHGPARRIRHVDDPVGWWTDERALHAVRDGRDGALTRLEGPPGEYVSAPVDAASEGAFRLLGRGVRSEPGRYRVDDEPTGAVERLRRSAHGEILYLAGEPVAPAAAPPAVPRTGLDEVPSVDLARGRVSLLLGVGDAVQVANVEVDVLGAARLVRSPLL